MIKTASKDKFEPGPGRPAKVAFGAKGWAGASAKAGSRALEGFSKELGAARERKAASTADLLTRIVKEQHVVLDLRQGQSLQRFSRKNFSPAIRNGLASRAFSRTKLDAFVAATGEKTLADLHGRIKLCVSQKLPVALRSQADALKKKVGERQTRAELAGLNQSGSLLPQRHSPHPNHPNHASLKSLLDSKPEELLIHEESKVSRRAAKSRSSSKAAVQMLSSPVQQHTLFPRTYKILVREDRQIVSRFDAKAQLSEGNRFSLYLQGRKEDHSIFK